jgi:hypothetical protein
MQYALKVLISALVIVAISELAKRSSLAGAILASLPLTSILAFVWLYTDSRSTEQVAGLSTSIFWLVLPSLVLFLVLPGLLRQGWGFWASLGSAIIATLAAYLLMLAVLPRLGVKL